ncbi:MAG: PAS domain S-box protein [Thermodesulfobacteriota bacterium]
MGELTRALSGFERISVIRIGPEGEILCANPCACETYGYSEEEFRALRVFDLDPDLRADEWPGYFVEFRVDGASRFVRRHRRRDGYEFPVQVVAHHVTFAGGESVLAFLQDISAQMQAERSLRRALCVIDGIWDPVYWIGSDGALMYVNDAACRFLGYDRDELLRMTLFDINPRFTKDTFEEYWSNVRKQGRWLVETVQRTRDGRDIPVEAAVNRIHFEDEDFNCSLVRDISERKQAEIEREALEEQLRQAQKMESIGRLAGGIAHDFNNMLTIILGYAELMRKRLAGDDPLLKYLTEIEKAGGHSRDVTSQLLAFSRKQVIAPGTVNLNELLDEMQKTLLHLIGEDIRLRIRPAAGLWNVRIDPAQFGQVLVNLALNARDAMPNGGHLTIATSNERLDGKERSGAVRTQEDYVLLEVTDTGFGMDPDTLSHIFEPFFTTKEIGKGTGLGLSTVYGIVRQNGGRIEAVSEQGTGTTFRIRIPRLAECDLADPAAEETTEWREESLSGTVLLVEDQAAVRGLATRMLEETGLTVVAAESPFEALSLLRDEDRLFDLLLTDVVMPGMNGRELAEIAEAERPGIAVLFMSGYSQDLFVNRGILEKGAHFLTKPFNRSRLVRAVRDALDPGAACGGIS